MACVVNPDGTITCSDLDAATVVNAVGDSSWAVGPIDRAKQKVAVDTALAAQEYLVLLLDAGSVRAAASKLPV